MCFTPEFSRNPLRLPEEATIAGLFQEDEPDVHSPIRAQTRIESDLDTQYISSYIDIASMCIGRVEMTSGPA